MTYNRPWNAYRQISAQTASPGQLVLMLYDGAVKFLEKSLSGFDLEDPAESNETISNNVIRAQGIINELNVTLNLEAGGQLAHTLRRLYHYMDEQLMQSNLRKSPEGIRDTIRRLTTLRDAWQQIVRQRPTEPANATDSVEIPSLCACG